MGPACPVGPDVRDVGALTVWVPSAACLVALARNDRTVHTRCEVRDPAGGFIAALTVVTGAVAEDETQQVRRQLSMAIVPFLPDGTNLVIGNPGDMLNPVTGNELYPAKGVVLADGSVEWIPLGVFEPMQPNPDDTGDGWTYQISGGDRSTLISRNKWQGPYPAGAGLTVDQAIMAGIVDRWGSRPALNFNFASTTITIPDGTVLGEQVASDGTVSASSGQNDPWADFQQWAASAGMELFFDRRGWPTLRVVPDVTSAPLAASYVEGNGNDMVELARVTDTSITYNQITVVGTGALSSDGSTPGVPVQATVSDTNPASPLNINGGFGPAPADLILDSTCSTIAECTFSATARLALAEAAADQTKFTVGRPNPLLDAGDADYIVRARMKVNETYVITNLNHPFEKGTSQAVANRTASVTVS